MGFPIGFLINFLALVCKSLFLSRKKIGHQLNSYLLEVGDLNSQICYEELSKQLNISITELHKQVSDLKKKRNTGRYNEIEMCSLARVEKDFYVWIIGHTFFNQTPPIKHILNTFLIYDPVLCHLKDISPGQHFNPNSVSDILHPFCLQNGFKYIFGFLLAEGYVNYHSSLGAVGEYFTLDHRRDLPDIGNYLAHLMSLKVDY